MKSLIYQSPIIAYHGCDRSVRDAVLMKGAKLSKSQNDYDWLGHGVYFWEEGPERAMKWAEQQRHRGRLAEPAVLGALLNPGHCFNLLDSAYTDVLRDSFPEFCFSLKAAGKTIPHNETLRADDPDKLLRRLDCAVINWTLEQLESTGASFDSVRGVFQEGKAAFPDSGIRLRSHIQIAVRHPACVLGYFLPA